MNRCTWTGDNQLMAEYHDKEWGVPLHDDQKLFEFLILDGFQAGLSWFIILKKREHFRLAFDNFDAEKIVRYDDKKIAELRQNKDIVRNKLKINAAVRNAQCFLDIQEKYGSFDSYIWQFVDNEPVINHYKHWKDIPANTKESDAMSKDLKKRGFTFVGTTICYAFMQAAGMVNDHEVDCFRHKELCNYEL